MSKKIAFLVGPEHSQKELSVLCKGNWPIFENPDDISLKDLDGLILLGPFGVSPEALLKTAYEEFVPILTTSASLNYFHEDVELALPEGESSENENHISCPDNDYITDRAHKVTSTPGFYEGCNEESVNEGLERTLKEFLEMS